MAKPRVTATDALANMIEIVELGRRTGLLLVERGSGSVLEEGEIFFVGGRPIYASLAGLRGREALAALSRWGACRFAFDPDAARPVPNLGAGPSQSSPGTFGESGTTPRPSASVPGASQPGGLGLYPQMEQGWNGSQAQRYGGFNGASANGGYSPPGTGQLGSGAYSTPAGQSPQGGQGPLMRRPRRAPDVRDLMTVVSSYQLSRAHRALLLLADGEHTLLDISRLSARPVDEVAGLLSELEARGLIYYY